MIYRDSNHALLRRKHPGYNCALPSFLTSS